MPDYRGNRQKILDRIQQRQEDSWDYEYRRVDDELPDLDFEEVRLTDEEKQARREKWLRMVRGDNERHRIANKK